MIKKFKDLTQEEINKIYQKQQNCTKCPLNNKTISCYANYRDSANYWTYWEKHKEIEL